MNADSVTIERESSGSDSYPEAPSKESTFFYPYFLLSLTLQIL